MSWYAIKAREPPLHVFGPFGQKGLNGSLFRRPSHLVHDTVHHAGQHQAFVRCCESDDGPVTFLRLDYAFRRESV